MEPVGHLLSDTTPHAPVYCGTCVYYQGPYGRTLTHDVMPHQCLHPHAVYETHTYLGIARHRHTPEERNAQNDCLDYAVATLQNRWHLGTFGERVKIVFTGVFIFVMTTFLLSRVAPVTFAWLRHYLGF